MSETSEVLSIRWLCQRLSRAGVISQQQAREALVRLERSAGDAAHPLNRLGALNLMRADTPGKVLDTEALCRWLAAELDLGHVRIDPLKVDIARITRICTYAYAERARILPLSLDADGLTVAVCEPFIRDWEAELARTSGRRIRRVIANPADISRYAIEFFALSRSIRASEKEQARRDTRLQNLEQLTELGLRGNLEANDQHVVGIVDWLLQYAFEQRASDIHLEPRRETGNVRFRIDGQMQQVFQMPDKVMAAVSSRLKILGRLDLAEKRRPQDGRIKTRSADGEEIELRLSSMPTAFGEKLVLRIFDPDTLLKSYQDLGLEEAQATLWRGITASPHGIVLVTGPTGSGKTSTLYSTLRQLARPEVNVCTVEDPIELVEPLFNQMQVNPQLNLDFAAGVRTLLRQDPDIIMVGEIRDLATAEVAIQAALTGHLVLSTLHTNDASAAVTRLMDLGVPAFLIRATLLGVLAQRLVRRLCPHCAVDSPPDPDEWRLLAGPRPVPALVKSAPGCLECRGTGYIGRVGLYELLDNNAELRVHISEGMDENTLRQAARRQGMQGLREMGVRRVLSGQTTPREVLRSTPGD